MGAIIFFALPFPIELPDQIGGFPTTLVIAVNLGLALIVTLLLLFLRHLIRAGRHIRNASREGRRISQAALESLPLTSFRRNGVPGDPLNVRIIATEAQLGAAFANAGWYRADEITLITALRISIDSLLARKYSTAPVSNLYLFGRRQDIAFEQPGRSVRERDHVRFWKTTLSGKNPQHLWIGGATKDIKVALSPRTHMPTHLIAPDVDTERDFLAQDLAATGWVVRVEYASGFGREIQRSNGDGGKYFSDGGIAVLELADIPTLPIAAQVRGTLSARFIKNVIAPILRKRLPVSGSKQLAQVRKIQADRAASSAHLKKPGGS